jgi:hypothetical protein
MYAYGVSFNQLSEIAAEIGVGIQGDTDGNRVRFTLKPSADQPLKFRKFNPNPEMVEWTENGAYGHGWTWRKANAVCFHGHWDFIEAVLESYPEAEISSSRYGKVRYNAENFIQLATEYGNQRMGKPGNIYHGFQIRDCCRCEHELG